MIIFLLLVAYTLTALTQNKNYIIFKERVKIILFRSGMVDETFKKFYSWDTVKIYFLTQMFSLIGEVYPTKTEF